MKKIHHILLILLHSMEKMLSFLKTKSSSFLNLHGILLNFFVQKANNFLQACCHTNKKNRSHFLNVFIIYRIHPSLKAYFHTIQRNFHHSFLKNFSASSLQLLLCKSSNFLKDYFQYLDNEAHRAIIEVKRWAGVSSLHHYLLTFMEIRHYQV